MLDLKTIDPPLIKMALIPDRESVQVYETRPTQGGVYTYQRTTTVILWQDRMLADRLHWPYVSMQLLSLSTPRGYRAARYCDGR